jgi:predicted O-methyltransferase YrrM
MLEMLGIAHPSYRQDFYTLAKLVTAAAETGGGTIAECGVYRGATLLGMAHLLNTLGAAGFRLIGFDSFEGFPEPREEDALPGGQFHPRALRGVFGDTSYNQLLGKVRALGYQDRIALVKGYFENTLHQWAGETFSIVHLDCDLYQSYVECLNFFYPRVRKGGFIVFDEYDFIADVYPGAQRAIDEFLADKPEKIQWFPEAAKRRCYIVKA